MFWSWKFWSEIHLWTDHHWITWQKSFKVSRLDCWGASRDSTADCFGHPANDWQSGDIEALQITDCLQKIYSHNTLVTKQIIGKFCDTVSLNSGQQAKNATEHTGHMTDNWQSRDTQHLQFDRKLQKKTYLCHLCYVARILSIYWKVW